MTDTRFPEGILDAVMTTLGALHDRQRRLNSRYRLDLYRQAEDAWAAEVAFADELFGRVEQMLNLPENTIRWGSWMRSGAPV